jgi:hypothetical protein
MVRSLGLKKLLPTVTSWVAGKTVEEKNPKDKNMPQHKADRVNGFLNIIPLRNLGRISWQLETRPVNSSISFRNDSESSADWKAAKTEQAAAHFSM